MVEVPIQGRSRWMLAPPPHLERGAPVAGRGPDVLLRTLATANLAKRGGTLLGGARAHALRLEGGRCTGVAVRRGGRAFDVRAASVVLADGEFQGNPQLVQRFVGATAGLPHPSARPAPVAATR